MAVKLRPSWSLANTSFFGSEATEREDAMLYHVTDCWDGGDLLSARARWGDDAIARYLERWPDAGVEMATAHVDRVFCFRRFEEAVEALGVIGGELLEIYDEYLDVEDDPAEGYPSVAERIDKQYISRMQLYHRQWTRKERFV